MNDDGFFLCTSFQSWRLFFYFFCIFFLFLCLSPRWWMWFFNEGSISNFYIDIYSLFFVFFYILFCDCKFKKDWGIAFGHSWKKKIKSFFLCFMKKCGKNKKEFFGYYQMMIHWNVTPNIKNLSFQPENFKSFQDLKKFNFGVTFFGYMKCRSIKMLVQTQKIQIFNWKTSKFQKFKNCNFGVTFAWINI